jgi:hypothetical protein
VALTVKVVKSIPVWIPTVVLAILGFVLPQIEPSAIAAVGKFIANNPEWGAVIAAVSGFIINVLRSPVSNPIPRAK